jgi:protein SCO1
MYLGSSAGLADRKAVRKFAAALVSVLAIFWLSGPVSATDRSVPDGAGYAHSDQIVGIADTDRKEYVAVRADYTVPAVTLTNAQGEPVLLTRLLAEPRPVLLQFIFTSCSTVCPLLTATFSQAQAELDRMPGDYRMISISIDPEFDTPQHLAAYAKRYNAGRHWLFLTGQNRDIRSVMKAFDALYQSGNKMSHRSLIYLRASPGRPWCRIEGFLNVTDLVKQFRSVLGAGGYAAR